MTFESRRCILAFDMKFFKWETGACILFLQAALTVATFKYNKGDFLSSADRDIPFPVCYGAPGTRTLGSILDEGKAILLDKSYHM